MAGKIKNKRLFLALLLPDEVISFLSSLAKKLPGRFLPPENLHLTLFFFGQVGEEKAGEIEEVLSKAAWEEKPFVISLSDLSFFPNFSRPRGIWVKVGGQDETRLFSFRQKLKEALSAKNIDFDQKPFLPHITLTRFSKKEKVFKKSLPRVPAREFKVSSIGLLESRLSPKKPVIFYLKKKKLEF